jgi:hypothetical protein
MRLPTLTFAASVASLSVQANAAELNLAKLLDDGWELKTVTQSNDDWCPFTNPCKPSEREKALYLHLTKGKGLAVCIGSAWMNAEHPKSECKILKASN